MPAASTHPQVRLEPNPFNAPTNALITRALTSFNLGAAADRQKLEESMKEQHAVLVELLEDLLAERRRELLDRHVSHTNEAQGKFIRTMCRGLSSAMLAASLSTLGESGPPSEEQLAASKALLTKVRKEALEALRERRRDIEEASDGDAGQLDDFIETNVREIFEENDESRGNEAERDREGLEEGDRERVEALSKKDTALAYFFR